MSHDRDFDYRISAGQLQASLRHADEDFAYDQPAADEDILGDHLAELSEANHAFLRELDDDQEAPADTTTSDQAEAIAVAQPLPGNAHVEPSDTLTDDDLEAIAELEEQDQRPAVVYVKPAPASKFESQRKATTPEELARLAKQTDMLRAAQARDAANGERRSEPFKEAKKRISASKREAKAKATADARRASDAERKRVERAGQITTKRTTALEEAIAHHDGDRFLINLRGRAAELAKFREDVTAAWAQHGPKASMTEIANICGATKSEVQKRLKNVAKLEAKGCPWYRWRES